MRHWPAPDVGLGSERAEPSPTLTAQRCRAPITVSVMGAMSIASWPGRHRLKKVRLKQVRAKERTYQAWRTFVTVARAEHAATNGKCDGSSPLHPLLLAAQAELEQCGLPGEAKGYAEIVVQLLHNNSLTIADQNEFGRRLAEFDADIRLQADVFP